MRGQKGKHFNYRDIKNVYTIVFFESSTKEFHQYPDQWLHAFRQESDTGLFMELLQEYLFIPLDIFEKTMENKPIETELEAWLAFLSFEEPERIEELITGYPRFKDLYQDIYDICLNMEKVMSMYSKELAELDHNTVMYMIDEMQAELEQKDELLEQKDQQLEQKDQQLEQKDEELAEKDQQLSAMQKQIQDLQKRLGDRDI